MIIVRLSYKIGGGGGTFVLVVLYIFVPLLLCHFPHILLVKNNVKAEEKLTNFPASKFLGLLFNKGAICVNISKLSIRLT